MGLVDMQAVLEQRHAARVGLGAFNVVLLEHAEAFVSAAESAGQPVVLQISQNCVRYHRSLEPLALACLAMARSSSSDVVVHLDHADDVNLIERALDLGVRSIMYDGSRLPYAENVAHTTEVTAICHGQSAHVEAELGEVGGKDGVHAPGARTDPGEAARFVEQTRIDSLAVAVGSSHAKRERDLSLDRELIEQLAEALPGTPLVLHGGSSVDDAGIVSAVEGGITKINMSTHLNKAFTDGVRGNLLADVELVDPRSYVAAGREQMAVEAARLLRVLAATRART